MKRRYALSALRFRVPGRACPSFCPSSATAPRRRWVTGLHRIGRRTTFQPSPEASGIRHGNSLWVANHLLSLILGIGGGWAYVQFRFRKIKRHAPSAKQVGLQVALTEQDYQRLPKKEDGVVYFTRNEDDPSD